MFVLSAVGLFGAKAWDVEVCAGLCNPGMTPSVTECKITVGIWVFGLLILTTMLTVAFAIFSKRVQLVAEPNNQVPAVGTI